MPEPLAPGAGGPGERFDFSVLEIAGPATAVCGRLLADAGGEVVKLEAPSANADATPAETARRRYYDTDKRSLVVDLGTPEGQAQLAELAPRFDVVVEAMPPGQLDRIGSGYRALTARNPALTLVSITPFGQDGPYAGYQADDLVAFAMGGLMYISGAPDAPPVVAPCEQAHVVGGIHAAIGALAGLEAAAGGRGEWVDVSMMECLAAQENTISNFRGPGEFSRRTGSQHRTANPGRIFRCKDGYFHIFVNQERRTWERFVKWVGSPAELESLDLAEINQRWRHADLVTGVMERFAAERTREELVTSGQALHLPVVPVSSVREALDDPQTRWLDLVERVAGGDGDGDGGYLTLKRPLHPKGKAKRTPAPRPGGDTAEVLERFAGQSAEGHVEEQAEGHAAMGGAPGARPLPLEGVRVLAFTHVAAGPYSTLQLAYLGAEVIKVESATRIDPWRYRDRNHDPERSRPFADHNKNTRSVTIDLKTDEGLRLARALAAKSDVVIDNYSAGVMDRLGLGYRELAAEAPGIIAIHLSGLGSSGPSSHFVTFGPSMMALSGMTSLWNHPDRPEPVGSQTSYPDYVVGAYAAYAALAALGARRRGGTGREIDLTQLEVVAATLGPAMVSVLDSLGDPAPEGNRSATAAPYGCYPCKGDDAWCVISVSNDAEWLGLRRAMGDPDWSSSASLERSTGRLAERDRLDECVAAWTSTLSPSEVFHRCQAQGVPSGVVATGADLASDPHLEARGFLLDMEHPRMGVIRLPGPPIRFASGPLPVWRLGPLLGEDNQAVLGGLLGITGPELERLTAEGVIR